MLKLLAAFFRPLSDGPSAAEIWYNIKISLPELSYRNIGNQLTTTEAFECFAGEENSFVSVICFNSKEVLLKYITEV